MDYSQFLYMKEELSLVAVILIIFLADLFMNPDKRNNMNNARFATILPIVLMVIHTIINLVPAAGSAEAFRCRAAGPGQPGPYAPGPRLCSPKRSREFHLHLN